MPAGVEAGEPPSSKPSCFMNNEAALPNHAADFTARDRSDLKPTRISSERNCGCSHAAKCPPFGSRL